jgi:hypothetical protein
MASTKKPAKKAAASKPASRTRKAASKVAKPAAEVKKAGRPPLYNEVLADKVCSAIADGDSLRQICARAGMPSRETVRVWLENSPDFRAKYARAREEQGHSIHDEIHELERDLLTKKVAPDVARVALASKQWRASKLNPKVYGDRITHQGDDEAPPIQVESTELTMTQRAARLSSLLALAGRQSTAGGSKQ